LPHCDNLEQAKNLNLKPLNTEMQRNSGVEKKAKKDRIIFEISSRPPLQLCVSVLKSFVF